MSMRLLAAILASAVSCAVSAGDPVAGKAKSAICAACHGANGISANPFWPNLKGQKEQYLIKQMREFRGGQRIDPLMSPMVKSLSDADIENLAAYFSSL